MFSHRLLHSPLFLQSISGALENQFVQKKLPTNISAVVTRHLNFPQIAAIRHFLDKKCNERYSSIRCVSTLYGDIIATDFISLRWWDTQKQVYVSESKFRRGIPHLHSPMDVFR